MELEILKKEYDLLSNSIKKVNDQELMFSKKKYDTLSDSDKEKYNMIQAKMTRNKELRKQMEEIRNKITELEEMNFPITKAIENLKDDGTIRSDLITSENAIVVEHETTYLDTLLEEIIRKGGHVLLPDFIKFVYNNQIDFSKPNIIDSRVVYPIDFLLFNPRVPAPNANFLSVLRVVNQNGGKIDIERVDRESSPEIKVLVHTYLDSLKQKEIRIPSIPKTCGKMSNWDWKLGTLETKDKINYDYFSCGKYFFDGEYVLVEFPAGMTLYHGSSVLGNSASTYPVGSQFYKPAALGDVAEIEPTIAGNSKYNVEELLTEYQNVDMAWFSSANNAVLYTKDEKIKGCENFCMHAYTLTQNCVFFLLNNPYNLNKLLKHDKMTDSVRTSLRSMFTIPASFEYLSGPFGPSLQFERVSIYREDKAFAEWMCQNVIYGNYAGYCAPEMTHKQLFHLEFIICNPILFLKRDLSNVKDMFYDAELYPNNIRILFEQMKKYETVNTNFHSGDLFEHSIWSLLFAEHLSERASPKMNDRLKKLIMAAALVHDIGKMSPSSCERNKIRNKYIYYEVADHPDIGARYFDTSIPILDENLSIVGALSPKDVITDILPDVTDEELDAIKHVIKLHWYFGDKILKVFNKRGTAEYTNAINFYKKLFNQALDKNLAILVTIIVSIADIEATQPYTKQKLAGLSTEKIKETLRSNLLPYIISKPKKYKGTSLPYEINVSDNGILALNDVVSN